jgi:hypothetical protein
MQPHLQLATRPGQSTAISLSVTGAPSLALLLNSADPGQRTVALIKQWRSLTPALAQQSAQVSSLEAAAKGDTSEALGNLLTFAAAQFNVGKNLNDVQIALLASEMLRIYWHWRFDEFSFVLREAVAGRYGTTYDRLDAATVHEWCAKYEADRNALAAEQAEREARAYKEAEQQPARSELASQPGYAELRAKLQALSDDALCAGGKHYEALASRTEEEEVKLAVALEVWNARKASRFRQQLLAQFAAAGITGQTEAEKEAERKTQDHALGLALLRGDWQAAGFKGEPSAEWLAKINAPVNEPTDELPTTQQAA